MMPEGNTVKGFCVSWGGALVGQAGQCMRPGSWKQEWSLAGFFPTWFSDVSRCQQEIIWASVNSAESLAPTNLSLF